MNEYRALIPVGSQLPQTEKLMQIQGKGDDGQEQTITVMVSSIRAVTWGTKQGTDLVAGVFVNFWGTPWPPIFLPEDVKRKRRKHVVAYDRDTGLANSCFNSDDIMEEVPPGSCPACARRESTTKVSKGGDGIQ